jgi:hypothetical protein
VSEEYISFLSLVMRVDEFVVLHFFEALHLRLYDGVGCVGVDGFGVDCSFYFSFALLVYLHL